MTVAFTKLVILRLLLIFGIFAPIAGLQIREKPKAKKKAIKQRPTVRAYKKKKPKKQKQYKAPKLTPAQQAYIERYRLGGNRSGASVGGEIPV